MPQIKELSDEELLQKWFYWDVEIHNAKAWGAALTAAHEFRTECKQEIDRRNRRLQDAQR